MKERAPRVVSRLSWPVGAVVAVAVLGPALRPGGLLGLDLVFLDRIPVPPGIWGLGPELPRRVPMGVPMAWLSTVVGAPVVGKALFLGAIAGAFVGAARLVGAAPLTVRLGAGLLYSLSPFLLTRIAVGQWGVLVAAAVLPFALPVLLRPGDDLRRTFMWCAALAFTGFVGGAYSVIAVAIGIIVRTDDQRHPSSKRRHPWGAALVALAPQVMWLVPGLIVMLGTARPAGAASFRTSARGVAGVLGLAAGHGFWRNGSQIGGASGVGVAALGLVVLVLAWVGAPALPNGWRKPGIVLVAVGFALPLASVVPGVRGAYGALASTPVGLPLREGQRMLALALVILAPAAALGAARLGSTLYRGVPIVIALVLAAPGLWGLGGALQPVNVPASWAQARHIAAARPGPVLALPWHQYLDVGVAGGRRVLNPLRDLLGGDVLSASDPELGGTVRESVDPREASVDPMLRQLAGGQPVADQLRLLGIRYVAVLHDVDWRQYDEGLRGQASLRAVVTSSTLDVYEVTSWRGAVIEDGGRAVRAHPVMGPLWRVAPSATATVAAPAMNGWLRGFRAAGHTREGLIRLPSGRGFVWYWPAIVSCLVEIVVVVCAVGVGITTAATTWTSSRRTVTT